MNGEQPKVEIFEPFGDAYAMMKKILFQPFDLTRWLVIGFAAFLSGAWGHGVSFRWPTRGDWNFRSTSYGDFASSDSLPWLIPVLVFAGVAVLILVVLFMWLSARGKFIFTDCVVRNRAAIAIPWREYRREGNSLFLFSLAVGLVSFILFGGLVLVAIGPLHFLNQDARREIGVALIFVFIFLALIGLGVAIIFSLIMHFMVPIMYRRHCRALDAFTEAARLILAHPGPIILYVLFGFVLLLAFVIVSTLVTCLTCCIAGLPYINSVVFLPLTAWLLAFKLLFLRQFGPDYDVWAGAPDEPPVQSPTPPDAAPPESASMPPPDEPQG